MTRQEAEFFVACVETIIHGTEREKVCHTLPRIRSLAKGFSVEVPGEILETKRGWWRRWRKDNTLAQHRPRE